MTSRFRSHHILPQLVVKVGALPAAATAMDNATTGAQNITGVEHHRHIRMVAQTADPAVKHRPTLYCGDVFLYLYIPSYPHPWGPPLPAHPWGGTLDPPNYRDASVDSITRSPDHTWLL